MPILLLLLAVVLGLLSGTGVLRSANTHSSHTRAVETGSESSAAESTLVVDHRGIRNEKLCAILEQYPRSADEFLSFESGTVSALCEPYVGSDRAALDQCGDAGKDPYVSQFTWATRTDMEKRGRGNLFLDPQLRPQLKHLKPKVESIRKVSSEFCCGLDQDCWEAMKRVEVSLCDPAEDPNVPDPCVFGGSYRMPGVGYSNIFQLVYAQSRDETGAEESEAGNESEIQKIAARNLTRRQIENLLDHTSENLKKTLIPLSGRIVLSSYVPKSSGIRALEPILQHEFGHACSMVKMQLAALKPQDDTGHKLRALEWLDRTKDRCQPDLELPSGYIDFWESLGETREFAVCLERLALKNQNQEVDRFCEDLCPGHYLEESVGIAFSLLIGDLKGRASSVYPQTCRHVRDGQHPMVSDIVDCLAQNSTRFRSRMRRSYGCQSSR